MSFYQSIIALDTQFTPKELIKVEASSLKGSDSKDELLTVLLEKMDQEEREADAHSENNFKIGSTKFFQVVPQAGDNDIIIKDDDLEQTSFCEEKVEIPLTKKNSIISDKGTANITPPESVANIEEKEEIIKNPRPLPVYQNQIKHKTFEINVNYKKVIFFICKFGFLATLIAFISNVIAFNWNSKPFSLVQIVFVGMFYGFLKSAFLIKIMTKISKSHNTFSGKYAVLKTHHHRVYEPKPFQSRGIISYFIKAKNFKLLNLIKFSSSNIIEATFETFKLNVLLVSVLFCGGMYAVIGFPILYLTEAYNEFVLLGIIGAVIICDICFNIVYFYLKKLDLKQTLKRKQNKYLQNIKFYQSYIKEVNNYKNVIRNQKKNAKFDCQTNHDTGNSNKKLKKLLTLKSPDTPKIKKESINYEANELMSLRYDYEKEEDANLEYESLHQLLSVLNFFNVSTLIKIHIFHIILYIYLAFNLLLGSIFVMFRNNIIALYLFYFCYIISPVLMYIFQFIVKFVSSRTGIKVQHSAEMLVILNETISYRLLLFFPIRNPLYAVFLSLIRYVLLLALIYRIIRRGNKADLEYLRKLTRLNTITNILKEKLENKEKVRQSKILNASFTLRKSVFDTVITENHNKRNKKQLLFTFYTTFIIQMVLSFTFIFQYIFFIYSVLEPSYRTYHYVLILANIVLIFILEFGLFLLTFKLIQKKPGYFTIHFLEIINKKIFRSHFYEFASGWFYYYYLFLVIFYTIYNTGKSSMEHFLKIEEEINQLNKLNLLLVSAFFIKL